MATPDPERAFVARLRDQLDPAVHVDTVLQPDRPQVVVDLLPAGGVTRKKGYIDTARLDLVCYGTDVDTGRTLAGQVRAAVEVGFIAAGVQVTNVDADPPYRLPDNYSFEVRWFVQVHAVLYGHS